jgi:hypothetical protein
MTPDYLIITRGRYAGVLVEEGPDTVWIYRDGDGLPPLPVSAHDWAHAWESCTLGLEPAPQERRP